MGKRSRQELADHQPERCVRALGNFLEHGARALARGYMARASWSPMSMRGGGRRTAGKLTRKRGGGKAVRRYGFVSGHIRKLAIRVTGPQDRNSVRVIAR